MRLHLRLAPHRFEQLVLLAHGRGTLATDMATDWVIAGLDEQDPSGALLPPLDADLDLDIDLDLDVDLGPDGEHSASVTWLPVRPADSARPSDLGGSGVTPSADDSTTAVVRPIGSGAHPAGKRRRPRG